MINIGIKIKAVIAFVIIVLIPGIIFSLLFTSLMKYEQGKLILNLSNSWANGYFIFSIIIITITSAITGTIVCYVAQQLYNKTKSIYKSVFTASVSGIILFSCVIWILTFGAEDSFDRLVLPASITALASGFIASIMQCIQL